MAPVPECWYIYPAATCIRRIFDRIEISKKKHEVGLNSRRIRYRGGSYGAPTRF